MQSQQGGDFRNLGIPADERGHLLRQIVAERFQGAERRKISLQFRRDQLEDVFGLDPILEPVPSGIA